METSQRGLKCSNNLVKRKTNHTWNHTGIMLEIIAFHINWVFFNCNFGSVDQVNVLFLRSFVGFSLFHSMVSLSLLANWSTILTGQQMAKPSQNLSDQNSLTNRNHPGLSWSHSLVKVQGSRFLYLSHNKLYRDRTIFGRDITIWNLGMQNKSKYWEKSLNCPN